MNKPLAIKFIKEKIEWIEDNDNEIFKKDVEQLKNVLECLEVEDETEANKMKSRLAGDKLNG